MSAPTDRIAWTDGGLSVYGLSAEGDPADVVIESDLGFTVTRGQFAALEAAVRDCHIDRELAAVVCLLLTLPEGMLAKRLAAKKLVLNSIASGAITLPNNLTPESYDRSVQKIAVKALNGGFITPDGTAWKPGGLEFIAGITETSCRLWEVLGHGR